MNNAVLYFIESGIAMGLFYGLYRLFMEKETNYSLSRFYLAGTVILSLILSCCHLAPHFSVLLSPIRVP